MQNATVQPFELVITSDECDVGHMFKLTHEPITSKPTYSNADEISKIRLIWTIQVGMRCLVSPLHGQ